MRLQGATRVSPFYTFPFPVPFRCIRAFLSNYAIIIVASLVWSNCVAEGHSVEDYDLSSRLATAGGLASSK